MCTCYDGFVGTYCETRNLIIILQKEKIYFRHNRNEMIFSK